MTKLLKIFTFRRVIFGIIILCLLALIYFDAEQLQKFANPDFLNNLSEQNFSPAAIFFILAASTWISEDLACITAGTLAAQGEISFFLATLACFVGIFIGDVGLFVIGRVGGRRILEYRITKRLFDSDLFGRAAHFIERYGLWTVFLSRFTFGLRLPIYLLAGMLKTSFWKFTFYFLLATIVWTPLLVGTSMWLGAEFFDSPFFQQNFLISLVIFVLGFFLVLRFILKMLDWNNRRIFWGRIKRIWNWEFWSLKFFYAPVFFYILWLGIKHRRLTIFTAANPAIYAGGFVGESKEEILKGLKQSKPAAPFLLEFTSINADLPLTEKLKIAGHFIDSNNLTFPFAVKPDIGERGKDVKLLENLTELEKYLAETKENIILQEFAGGEEVSVFYYRYPNEPKGKIYSITEKRFPFVVGDGVSDIEELILQDKRAVCLAKIYLEQNHDRLFEVPKQGEKIQIVEVGTHSRGAIFLDGAWMKTDALEQKIDEICRGVEGFYFGRFDIRINSFEDFKRGENFKIIELNGVTSESTNIYDPKHSLFSAYKILFKQWRIAFEIGEMNKENGAKPVSFSELSKMIFAYIFGSEPKSENEEVSPQKHKDAEIGKSVQ